MKKIISFFILAVMTIGLFSGCGKKNEKENPFFLHLYSAQRNVQKQRGKSGFSLHFGTGKCILESKKM